MGKQVQVSAGERFGRLEVISEIAERSRGGHRQFLVKCDCGNVLTVRAVRLVNGHTRSCGCLRRETTAITGRANKGEGSGNWKGDNVGYIGAHERIVAQKGSAKDHMCSEPGCSRRAYDWSYRLHEGFSTVPDDYRPLCRSCHVKLDKRAKKAAA
ncbi:MAG: hypothetical protein JSS68_15145 [Actinobacteria bacterium]|nr:hypothetical protein [Actinomycetota bacterium]